MKIEIRDESEVFIARFWIRTIDNKITGIADWFNETAEEREYAEL